LNDGSLDASILEALLNPIGAGRLSSVIYSTIGALIAEPDFRLDEAIDDAPRKERRVFISNAGCSSESRRASLAVASGFGAGPMSPRIERTRVDLMQKLLE